MSAGRGTGVDPGRRRFLKDAAGALGLLGAHSSGCALLAGPGDPGWDGLPPLDGALDRGAALREEMAADIGGNFHSVPAAVLQPRSTRDIAAIVRFAHARGLKVAMRGLGHAPYGQALAPGGIVVDSRTFRAVRLGPATAEAQAGASWDDVARLSLARGLAPPVMGDSMKLSVGGILSAGGIGNSSHLAGAVVDHVEELEVVTGTGEVLACSPALRPDLFEAALAGMGRCALITGARLRLVPAPAVVARRDLDYAALDTLMADYRSLASDGRFEHLGAYVMARGDGGFGYRINVGKFCADPATLDWPRLLSGLRFAAAGDPAPLRFSDYLHREAGRDAAAEARWRAAPTRLLYITLLVPESAAGDFVARMVAHPPDTVGMTRMSLYWLASRTLARPLLVHPRGDWFLTIFLFREAPAADAERCRQALAAVRDLAARVRAAGGKCYAPHAPFYTRTDWEEHYGPELWSRLAAAKERYDPSGVLTPAISQPPGLSAGSGPAAAG